MPTEGTSAGAAPRKVIVVGEDQRTAEAVRMAFERDGFVVVAATELGPEVVDESVGLIVASAATATAGRTALEQAVKARGDGGRDVPVLYVGNGVTRRDAVTAGADEVIGRPAFARDVVTIGKMLVGQPTETRGHWIGQLAETVSVYYLVRALGSLGRSGVLTLSRGLRRGEVRFYLGEVTSAQVGGLHGQAALHQLLLWTDGRFDFRREDLVRRRQIPLLPEELLADAERFLLSVKEVSGGLSPAMVFEQDPRQMHNQGRNVPTEVHGVLRMFDGNRTLADVIEDSPYRVFETMRVASMAVQAGLLRRVAVERPKTKFRVVLALEEWLAGESKDAVAARVASLADSGSSNPVMPAAAPTPAPAGKGRRKKRPPSAMAKPAPAAPPKPLAPTAIDWGALVPRGVAVEMQGLSQVVPTQQASGEITIPRDLDEAPATRKSTRERLESIASDARDRMFPTDGPPATVEVMPTAMAPTVTPAPVMSPAAVAAIPQATSGPSIDAVPKSIQSTGKTPVSFAIPMPSSTGIPIAMTGTSAPTVIIAESEDPEATPIPAESLTDLPVPEIISLPSPGNTLQMAVVPMPSAGETMRGVMVASAGDGGSQGDPLPPQPSVLIGPPVMPMSEPEDPTNRIPRHDLQAEREDDDEWLKAKAVARARADAEEQAEAAEWSRRERLARDRAAGEEAEANARAAAAEEAAAADRAHKTAEEAVAAAERAREEAGNRGRAAAAHLELAERMRIEMAERLRAEAERAEAEEAARAEADRKLEAERVRLEQEREAIERAEVDKALVRAKEIADRMRSEAAASTAALASAERLRAAAEQLNAETDAADRARVAAENGASDSATGAEAARAMAEAEVERARVLEAAKAEAARAEAASAEALAQAEIAKAEVLAQAEGARQAALDAAARAASERQAAHARAEAEAAVRVQAEIDARALAEADARARVDAEPEDVTAPRVRVELPPEPAAAAVAPATSAPVVPPPEPSPATTQPSMLTADLAAAHAAVANVVGQQADRASTTDARSTQAEAAVSGVRRDARNQTAHAAGHFDELEEQFFQQGASPSYGQPTEPVESFDDLDRGYSPSSFWDRLLGRDKKKPPPRKR